MDLVRLYQQCDMGMSGIAWPDGGALLGQPLKLVQAFNVIGSALADGRKQSQP
jgi:hypothetical protein